ncbi:MAG: Rrf2 family transcriptional regulator [Candidatus Omnitrophica bacterium]|nr:Rrf2 family transcriptional regulator [Candidatus Omnitrophota bacterium]
MKLSKKTEYALKALIELTIDYDKGINVTLINDIAGRENIPPRYLEQILLRLKNSGILISKRGVGGGYALSRPPEEISMGDVIREVEGSLVSKNRKVVNISASDEMSYGLNNVMAEATDAMKKVFDNISLKEMAERIFYSIEAKKDIPNYVI